MSRSVTARPQPPLVLHVIHHLVTGGMENGLVNLINHMPASAYRHAVVCIEDYSDFRDRIRTPGVEVVALHRSRIGLWSLRRQLFSTIRRLAPAIVHSRNLSGLDALLPARLAGVRRTVHGEHGWDVDNLRGERWKPILLRRLHAPLVSRYVTVSADLKRFLIDRVGIPPTRVMQICNGVDTVRFAPPSGDRDSALPPDFRGQDLLRIGTVGRAQPVKDQATLLHAFAAVLGRRPWLRPRLRLMIIGGGPLLEVLRALAATLGIADQCWLPGPMTDMPAVLQGLDIFVLTSLNEGISNTLLEAMATGLPVLATAVGGNQELVLPERVGQLFAPGDVAALAGLLDRLVDDSGLRQRWAAQARDHAVAQHGLGQMIEAYRKVYDELLQS